MANRWFGLMVRNSKGAQLQELIEMVWAAALAFVTGLFHAVVMRPKDRQLEKLRQCWSTCSVHSAVAVRSWLLTPRSWTSDQKHVQVQLNESSASTGSWAIFYMQMCCSRCRRSRLFTYRYPRTSTAFFGKWTGGASCSSSRILSVFAPPTLSLLLIPSKSWSCTKPRGSQEVGVWAPNQPSAIRWN